MNKIKSISYGATDNFFTTEPRSKAQGYRSGTVLKSSHHQTGCTEDEYIIMLLDEVIVIFTICTKR